MNNFNQQTLILNETEIETGKRVSVNFAESIKTTGKVYYQDRTFLLAM